MTKARRTETTRMIVAEMLDQLDGTGIELIGPNEPAPEQTDDSGSATVHTRWCKLYWPELSPLTKAALSADHRAITMIVAVGVSDSALDADEYQLSKDLDTVTDLLRGLHAIDAATGHELTLGEPDPDSMEPMGEDTRSRLGVVSISGTITRIVDPA